MIWDTNKEKMLGFWDNKNNIRISQFSIIQWVTWRPWIGHSVNWVILSADEAGGRFTAVRTVGASLVMQGGGTRRTPATARAGVGGWSRQRTLCFLLIRVNTAAYHLPLLANLFLSCNKKDKNEKSLERVKYRECVLEGQSGVWDGKVSQYPGET